MKCLNKRRIVLLIVAFCLLISLTVSSIELEHDCVGENCPVCIFISACILAAKIVFCCALSVLFIDFLYKKALISFENIKIDFNNETPVANKVKMTA